MKILERGSIKNDHYQVRCSKCNSLLEFDKNDIHGDQREGDYVVCPVCNSFIDVRRAKRVEKKS